MQDKVQKMSPEIRFKGYTDAWVLRKLGDIINVNSGRDYKHLNKGDIPVYGTGGYMLSVDKFLSDKNAVGIGRKGTINKPYVLYAPFWTVDTLFYTIPKTENDLFFISDIFQKINWLSKAESTGVPSLSKKTINNIKVYVPTFKEQQAIGLLLKKIDDLIALQQRKIDTLKLLKKALLQQMFPKNGKDIPRVRIVGFNNVWSEKKLKEIATHRSGRAIEKYFSENGKYKVISIGSYGTNNRYKDQGIRVISNSITNKQLVKKNELTMVLNDKTANGTIIGRVLLINTDNEYVVNQRTEIISPQKTFNSKFAFIILNNILRKKIKRITQGGTQIYVNYSSVENLHLYIPYIKEQQKIGIFFNTTDLQIKLNDTKIEKIKTLRKSLLQKIFR
ncbi:restriction endonuclease subunit S [Pediococcus pentosaceus]|uniref:restriction endonuclease subunit S n=1 Tax=Pediococcus pentosaceus TaxID=1255 RepID=UPI003F278191